MSILRYMQPARIRANGAQSSTPVDTLIDSLLVPVRQRLKLDQNTSLVISSMLDGLLIDCVALFSPKRVKMAKRRCWWAGAMRTGRVCGWRHGVFPNAAGMSTFSPNRWSRRGLSYFPGSIFRLDRTCRHASAGGAAQPLAGAGLQHPFSRPLSAPIRGADQGLSAWLQVNLAPI